MSKPCSDCGSDSIQWANNRKKDGSWGPMLFDSVPGGPMKSYEISNVGGKAQAKFVMNNQQVPGVDYYAAHYKTCTAKGGSGVAAGSPTPSRGVNATNTVSVKITVNGTDYEGVLAESVAF